MNRSITIAASVIGLIALARFAWQVSFEGSQEALELRFPHVDPSIIRAVHKEMVRESFLGTAEEAETDEEHDAIFWRKVESFTK